jgi:hypothetical protein
MFGGVIGLALMLTITFLYAGELGWPLLLGAWAIVLAAPLLLLVGLSGTLVFALQGLVIGGLFIKVKMDS